MVNDAVKKKYRRMQAQLHKNLASQSDDQWYGDMTLFNGTFIKLWNGTIRMLLGSFYQYYDPDDGCESQELKELIQKAHNDYLERFMRLAIALQYILIVTLCIGAINADWSKPTFISKVITTSITTVIIHTVNHFKSRVPFLLDSMFPIMMFINGVLITFENCLLPEYRFYEMWIIWYFKIFCLSVVYSLKCHYIIISYVSVQVICLVSIHYCFDGIDPFITGMIIFGIICYCMISLTISSVFHNQLRLVNKNKSLVGTIQNILEVMPYGVLINSGPSERKPVIKYANDEIEKQLFQKDSIDNKPVNILTLKCRAPDIRHNTSCKEELKYQSDSESDTQVIKVSEILSKIQGKIDAHSRMVKTEIEVQSCDNLELELTEDYSYVIKSIPVIWDKKESYLHLMCDITSLKQLESAKATNKCMHIMFSSVSHEFRTPLNSFRNILELFKASFENMKEIISSHPLPSFDQLQINSLFLNCQKYFNIGNISAKILENLVEDVLDFAKIEAGTFRLNPKAFTIHDLCKEVSYLFQNQCQRKGIDFRVNCTQSLRRQVFYSDSSRIRQALLNLISNSMKFTQKGFIQVTIFRDDQGLERYLKFIVEDTGVGISEEDQKSLFKLFGTVQKYRNGINLKGTGLGLTITQKLVNLLGGVILLSSKEHKGTMIEFTVKEFDPEDCESPQNVNILGLNTEVHHSIKKPSLIKMPKEIKEESKDHQVPKILTNKIYPTDGCISPRLLNEKSLTNGWVSRVPDFKPQECDLKRVMGH
ncbi:unnamed protein product [Moneuplotes crassus]|uniref:histidine kinase n=1 Tax=Euplotes crassus TaxID=5936 RepID=A0AAD2D9R2_EUPCR|nr:unnamed protein product [Moneuplotes crassus]